MKNDFANRLLGKAPAPAVRPLLPSFFEPVTGPSADWASPVGAITESVTPRTGPVLERPQETIQAAVSTEPVRFDVEPLAVSPVSAVRVERPALPPKSPNPIVSHPVEARTVIETRTATSPEHRPMPAPVPKPVTASASASALAPSRPPRSSRPSVAEPVPAGAPLPPEPVRPAVVAHHAHPVHSPTHRDQPVRPVVAAVPVAPRRMPAAEPTVHISIGRVEIKATAAEPVTPQRKEKPKRSVLSLDDYLHGRAGGARK